LNSDFSPDLKKIPRHVAIIMDGNGRWAQKRSLNRIKGHSKGTESVREVVRASRELGIEFLTLYAFSTENWKRPPQEVSALMKLLKGFLRSELSEMMKNGICLNAIGTIHRFPDDVRNVLGEAIAATSGNQDMTLNLALSYGGREEIVAAARRVAAMAKDGRLNAEEVTEALFSSHLYTYPMPDPDILIRTSGEMRISNFLLWQIAYSEIFVTQTLWPDFGKTEYLQILSEYQKRERRFGLTGTQVKEHSRDRREGSSAII
jgi:undecaprenyl diphosphate synthase